LELEFRCFLFLGY
jgi:transcription factor MYB, plant